MCPHSLTVAREEVVVVSSAGPAGQGRPGGFYAIHVVWGVLTQETRVYWRLLYHPRRLGRVDSRAHEGLLNVAASNSKGCYIIRGRQGYTSPAARGVTLILYTNHQGCYTSPAAGGVHDHEERARAVHVAVA